MAQNGQKPQGFHAKALNSLPWRYLESFGTTFIALAFSIVLARVLGPGDYGTVAILYVFINLSTIIIQMGFGSALIRKKDADDLDYSSVFWLMAAVCTLLYAVLFLASPGIARFYEIPELKRLLRLAALQLFAAPLFSVQNALIARNYRFRTSSVITLISLLLSGGTATPNFSRFAKSGKVGAITTVIAFFIGNSLMFFFGGVSSVYVGGNDIFEVMINLGLFYLAILVLGLNIWTTNDNALYSAGLGLANIFGQKKKPMVLVSGIIGTVLAVWLYWNFCGWLNILNCTLPPVGIILVLGYFLNKEKYQDVEVSENVNWFAVLGVVLGAVVANLVHWGIASINGMVVAAVCYLIGRAVEKK